MALTSEQVEQMMSAMTSNMMGMFEKILTAQSTKEAKPEFTNKQKELDARSFTRIDKFEGGEAGWAEWKTDMEVLINSINSDFGAFMKSQAKAKGEVDYDLNEGFRPRANELLGILFVLVTGEAKALIKSQTDGIEAWKVLCNTYSRRTLARTLRLYQEAVVPKRASAVTEIIGRITEWENKLNDLRKTEEKEIDPMIKLAALTEICTPEIRDMIYHQVNTADKLDDQAAHQIFTEVKQKIISWVSNRIASNSVTLDIGNVQAETECYRCDEGTDYLVDINAMLGKCYTCGGIGHPARLCPTKGQGKGKGTGKGGEGGGKGGPKGGWKGGGAYHQVSQTYNPKGFGKGGTPFRNQAAGNKGGGKGYQGSCWTCGVVGHKSAECRTNRTNLVETEEEETEQPNTREIGGVWLMHVAKVQTKNRYQALTQEEEEESEEGGGEQDHRKENVKANRVTGRKWKKLQHLPKTVTRCQSHFSPSVDPGSLPTQESPKSKIHLTRKESVITKHDAESKDVNVVEKLVAAAHRTETAVCQMTFHLTDASKILASVNKMAETGNEVVFSKIRSFIKSPTGKKAFLKSRNGVYLLDVIFFNGDEAVRGEVIIDSGAADHVMPRGMLENIVTREKEAGIKFVAADGAEIGNYGRKDVQFVPADFWEDEFGSPFTGRA